MESDMPHSASPSATPVTRNRGAVVVVHAGQRIGGLLDTLLGTTPFDVVAVESSAHAYSQIRRMQPSLVIVSIIGDDPGAFHVLSMLALDEATRGIPVIIHEAGTGQLFGGGGDAVASPNRVL
jgi:PleD family two-component response regulator